MSSLRPLSITLDLKIYAQMAIVSSTRVIIAGGGIAGPVLAMFLFYNGSEAEGRKVFESFFALSE